MRVLLIMSLLAVSACSSAAPQQQAQQNWDRFAYVDPMNLPDYGAIKSLQRPGMY